MQSLRDASQPTILFYNDDWQMAPRDARGVGAGCRLTFDWADLPHADIVVFHLPTLGRPGPLRKRPGQYWVGWSMESAVHLPALDNPAQLAAFDWLMTYRRDADIWTPYCGTALLAPLVQPPLAKNADAPVVYFASNARDRSGRTDYVRELMQHIPVHSYGRSLRNRTLAGDDGRATKLATIAHYPFTLAFENSVADDYVTEKYFDPLLAGSVPVVLGARNVADFAPGDHCHVDTRDFASPRDLAVHLRALAADAAAYAALLAWKAQPLRAGFMALLAATDPHPLVRLTRLWQASVTPQRAPGVRSA